MSIRVEGLEVVFREPGGAPVPVLSVPAFEIQDGQAICLTGGSGAGKTTFLNVLAGIVQPTRGRVVYGEVDITALSEGQRDRFRAQHIGYVFQSFHLLQGLTAVENVALALSLAGRRPREARERAAALLTRVALGHRLHARPGTLSVGEQQRVCIARAVANRPRVVLADEPTANLDERHGDEILALLAEVTSEAESILVLVTHEARVQARFERVVPLAELSR